MQLVFPSSSPKVPPAADSCSVLRCSHAQVPPDMQLLQVLGELSAKRCGCVLVVCPQGTLLGTFTDGDLRRSLQRLGAAVRSW